MAWIWMLVAVGAVLLRAVSLGRVLSSPSPARLPRNSTFLSPPRGDTTSRNVLLVLAHPDDESMFFVPTILFLKSKGHNIHIMCLSQGNADGLGNTRKEELYLACATLKEIPAGQVRVLDHPELQDVFHEKWDHGLIAELTMAQAQLWNIDTIVTFDSQGVSGNPNHRDVHHGICKLLCDNGQGHIEAWELEVLHMLRGSNFSLKKKLLPCNIYLVQGLVCPILELHIHKCAPENLRFVDVSKQPSSDSDC